MSTTKVFTNATGASVADNTNIMTAGPRGPALLQDVWLLEKLAHFDRDSGTAHARQGLGRLRHLRGHA
jgi:catalase